MGPRDLQPQSRYLIKVFVEANALKLAGALGEDSALLLWKSLEMHHHPVFPIAQGLSAAGVLYMVQHDGPGNRFEVYSYGAVHLVPAGRPVPKIPGTRILTLDDKLLSRENQPRARRSNSMKTRLELKNTAAMLSDDIVTVQCRFVKDSGGETAHTYTFKAPKAVAETLQKDDQVLCTKNPLTGLTVAIVDSVDKQCLLDDPAGTSYPWLISKIDTSGLDRLLAWEDAATEKLYDMQREVHKRSLADVLGSDLSDMPLSLPGGDSDG